MTIAAGSKLGGYEITAPLGAGGMGEVWLAYDECLKRKVALKLWPTERPTERSADVDPRRNFNRVAHQGENRRRFSILTRR